MATAVDSLKAPESTAARTALWPRIFEYWHLLSLDAPTVAALWSWSFARAMRLELPWHAPLLLALGTWLVYVADRILDGARPQPAALLRERHFFHARHRRAFLAIAAAVGCALLWLIVARMSANARFEDTVLFSAALLYLVLVHKPRLGGIEWLPKELLVGIVFAAATAVPAWSRLGTGRLTLLPAIVLFAALCWLNCVAIERWENLSRGGTLQTPAAHLTTRWTAQHFRLAASTLTVISVFFTCLMIFAPVSAGVQKTAGIYAAVALAALILGLVDYHCESFSELHLRVIADLALLTPALFFPFLA